MSDVPKKLSKIQQRNRKLILEAALDVFSAYGFRGATLDQIAQAAGLSKSNIIYYFAGKEEIHFTLLNQLLATWLEPLEALDPEGEPLAELIGYVHRKLELSRLHPRESRLFANEVLQGAPHLKPAMENELRSLVHEKARVIQHWIDDGRIAAVDPVHLIFSVWSLTQHYADFDTQVRAVLDTDDPFPDAAKYLETLFDRLLRAD